ncbi:maltose O-acetyltransferase [Planomicrobium soli]|uniref:Maltose O-acetyltransferase n=1 Tax=Planomicrobium soli TaxID=1176648 RepID=A0A2P8H3A6_9BACL|nr:DapH/DapD/GlmU-related protein [Planomicrobium soli]PSL40704.1 maltose O-acetyltransferase [Planomicrobium soli]
MRTLYKKRWLLMYYFFAQNLPPSFIFPLAKKIRLFFAKRILEEIGTDCNIEKGAIFSSRTKLGSGSGIGINCKIFGEVKIGNDVMIGPEVAIYSRNHMISDVNIPMRLQGYTEHQVVEVEDDVWIGHGVIILPGVRIGKGSVIGSGSIVTKSIPSYSIAIGNPAKVVKKRY